MMGKRQVKRFDGSDTGRPEPYIANKAITRKRARRLSTPSNSSQKTFARTISSDSYMPSLATKNAQMFERADVLRGQQRNQESVILKLIEPPQN